MSVAEQDALPATRRAGHVPDAGAEPGAVLHFAASWLPASEGFVYDLVRHVARRSVVVAGVRIENADRFPVPDLHCPSRAARLLPSPLAQKATTATLIALAARRRVALVHAHHGYDIHRVLGLVERRRLPLIVSLHGDDVTGLVAEKPWFYGHVVRSTRAVVVPSSFLADHAAHAGFPADQIRVIPSGIDTSFFDATPLPDDAPEVLFVGRFVEKKGLDVLARAWPQVQRAVPAARLRLLGFGPLETVARSIPGHVEVVLSPTRRDVRDAMRKARVVTSPSRTAPGDAVESLLVVNLEAQATGRPVVTTRHGGIPEYVREGETALLVPERDPSSLAEALVAVLRDDDLAHRLASGGPSWARRFDVHETARRIDDLYDELSPATAAGRRSR